jgi:hypothetical protein
MSREKYTDKTGCTTLKTSLQYTPTGISLYLSLLVAVSSSNAYIVSISNTIPEQKIIQ